MKDQIAIDDDPTFIDFSPGLYTLNMIKNTVNAQGRKGIFIDVLPNGDVRFQIVKGYKMTMTDLLPTLLGIKIPIYHKYLRAGEYLGPPMIHPFRTLRLHCNEIKDEDNLPQGQKSHIVHHFELNEHEYTLGLPIRYQYETPYFIPLRSSRLSSFPLD